MFFFDDFMLYYSKQRLLKSSSVVKKIKQKNDGLKVGNEIFKISPNYFYLIILSFNKEERLE